jgi:hypothetical protein
MDPGRTRDRDLYQRSIYPFFSRTVELYWKAVYPESSITKWSSLALLEMRVTLAKLVWHFDITLEEEGQTVPEYFHKQLASARFPVRVSPVPR